jgi:aspartate aminotransferase-like enzyme
MSLEENRCLLLPGPVFIPHRVLRAMGKQMINRRGPEFQDLLVDVTERLLEVFQTSGDVLLFPGSGTGGLEIALVNTLTAGDRVLALTAGVFSERFATIAEGLGMSVQRLRFPLNEGIDPERVAEALHADREKTIRAVLMTHNETATGVVNDIAALGPIVHGHGALSLVDAVSSLGGIELKVDQWLLDIVASVSHKGLFAAPGLTMLSVSKRAWEAIDNSATPSYFLDLRRARDAYGQKRLTPYTAPTTTLYALQEALRMIAEEGLADVLKRHAVITAALRAGLQALGLEPFVRNDRASPTVTAVHVPKGIDSAQMRKTMSSRYHVYIAGGLGDIAESTFRIGHLGYIGRGDILNGLSALELALNEQKYDLPLGQGVAAAQKVFSEHLAAPLAFSHQDDQHETGDKPSDMSKPGDPTPSP